MEERKPTNWMGIISVAALVMFLIFAAVISSITDAEHRDVSPNLQKLLIGIASAAILIVVSVIVFKLRRAASKRRKAKHLAD